MLIDTLGFGKSHVLKTVFEKLSVLIDEMNSQVLSYIGVKLEKRDVYAVDYVDEMLQNYKKATNPDSSTFVYGRGHRKSLYQK